MQKGTTNYKLIGVYVAKIIGFSTIDFFLKNSLSLNIFSTREDSTVKKEINKKGCLQEGACLQNKITHLPPPEK